MKKAEVVLKSAPCEIKSALASSFAPIRYILELKLQVQPVFSSNFLLRASKQFTVYQPASPCCLSNSVYPISWSQPNSDLLLVIQLLHPAGLLSPGPAVGGTTVCCVEKRARPPCSITLISIHNRTEVVEV